MLTSLTLLNYVQVDTEEEMLGYGIGIILLNIGMYFVAPAAALLQLEINLDNNKTNFYQKFNSCCKCFVINLSTCPPSALVLIHSGIFDPSSDCASATGTTIISSFIKNSIPSMNAESGICPPAHHPYYFLPILEFDIQL